MNCVDGGFYLLKDQYYLDFSDPYLKQNKQEHRPFYFCFQDTDTGLYWMIPLSSSTDKINLAKRKINEGKRDIFHITNVGGKDGVMLIADMCPVSSDYIKNQYAINGIPVIYKDKKELKLIKGKATKILALLRKGISFTPTQPAVLDIEAALIEKQKNKAL